MTGTVPTGRVPTVCWLSTVWEHLPITMFWTFHSISIRMKFSTMCASTTRWENRQRKKRTTITKLTSRPPQENTFVGFKPSSCNTVFLKRREHRITNLFKTIRITCLKRPLMKSVPNKQMDGIVGCFHWPLCSILRMTFQCTGMSSLVTTLLSFARGCTRNYPGAAVHDVVAVVVWTPGSSTPFSRNLLNFPPPLSWYLPQLVVAETMTKRETMIHWFSTIGTTKILIWLSKTITRRCQLKTKRISWPLTTMTMSSPILKGRETMRTTQLKRE